MSQRSARRFIVIWFKIAHTAGIILQWPQQFRPNDKHRAGDKTAVFGTQPHFRQHFIGTGIGKPVFPLRFDYQIVMRNHSGFGIAKKRQRPPQLFGRSHKTDQQPSPATAGKGNVFQPGATFEILFGMQFDDVIITA